MTESFTCPRCGRTSYNPHDAAAGYCGACHDWTARPASPVDLSGSGPVTPASPTDDPESEGEISPMCDIGAHSWCTTSSCACGCHHQEDVDDEVAFTWDPHACGWRVRELPDDRVVWVVRFFFTWAVIIGPRDAGGYDDRWCYASRDAAFVAALRWDPDAAAEPDGWHRHPSSGRRRAGGDPAREVVAP